MIEILCDFKYHKDIYTILSMRYDELLREEYYFCIKVNGNVFFEEPLFPILEFLYYCLKWDKKSDFTYNTLESNENPLIEFKKTFRGWKIDSVWKKYDCKIKFDLTEFIDAIENFINNSN